ncbi:DUF4817 domain-containing protein [Trichonephila clavipes]|nr:DUF4817 domain-containing protein [Trichonephila clavipes]
MNSYSNEKLVDMLIVYGPVDFNGHTTWLLYQKRYSNRRVPHHTTFASVNKMIRETYSFTRSTMNWLRTTKTYGNEEVVLRLVEDNPSMSTKAIAQQVALFQSIIWRIFAANKMSAYHLHHVQLLQPEDYLLRTTFATWFLQQSVTDSAFAAFVLFMDKEYFIHESIRKLVFVQPFSKMFCFINCFCSLSLLPCTIARNYVLCDPAFLCDSETSLYLLLIMQVCRSGSKSPCISIYP